jgi:hypothetical protein
MTNTLEKLNAIYDGALSSSAISSRTCAAARFSADRKTLADLLGRVLSIAMNRHWRLVHQLLFQFGLRNLTREPGV